MKTVLAIFSLLAAIQLHAAPKNDKTFDGRKIASLTADYINGLKSLEDFYSGTEGFVAKNEILAAKSFLKKQGVAIKSAIPKFKVDGNKIYLDKKNFILFDKANSININGHIFNITDKSMDTVVKEIYQQLNKKSVQYSIWLSPAHAGFSDIFGTLATVGAGALFGGTISKFILGGSFMTGAMYGGLAVGAFYLIKSLFGGSKNNDVSCEGPNYRVRTRHTLPPVNVVMTPGDISQQVGQDFNECDASFSQRAPIALPSPTQSIRHDGPRQIRVEP